MKSTTWELRARSGRAVLVNGAEREVDPARLPLPEALVDALHEWAHVVDAISEAPAGESAEDAEAQLAAVSGEVATQVSQRGRQLALRLAVETGGEIGYADPVTGEVDRVGRRRTSGQAAGRYTAGTPGAGVPARCRRHRGRPGSRSPRSSPRSWWSRWSW
ncbi:hypothetical protein [Saccharopolyspora erythraea]|uniref:hypothetical protein n=1 Tax=Saccharopolyspora erythraea TaxID=1836 RepID=UPI0001D30FD0|nr:hypothetical protein [Saccharopolyspora erythraea]